MSRALKDLLEVSLVGLVLGPERLHVDHRKIEKLENPAKGVRLSVPRWTHQEHSALPWNAELCVLAPRCEKRLEVIDHLSLERLGEDQIIERRRPNRFVQVAIFPRSLPFTTSTSCRGDWPNLQTATTNASATERSCEKIQ